MQLEILSKKLLLGLKISLIIATAAAGIQLDFLSLLALALAGLYDILWGNYNFFKKLPAYQRLICNMCIYGFFVAGILLVLAGVSQHILKPVEICSNVNIPLAICLIWFIFTICSDTFCVFSLNGKIIYWGIPLALMLIFALRSGQHISLGDSLFTIGLAINLLRKCYYQMIQEIIAI